jgi:hypothetical protein
MQIPPVGVELLHANRQTDMTKLIVAFPNFAIAAKNGDSYQLSTSDFFVAVGCALANL